MTFRDLVDLSVGSLWRIKLRATLTIAGVVIAIATFVAMLSFAAGNQRHVSNIYNEFGLLTNMRVFPKSGNGASDSTVAKILDAEAIQELSRIPGVKLAYPYDALDVTAAIADTVVTTTARALPPGAMQTTLINKLLAGADFSEDAAREAILTHEMMELTGIEEPDSLIGRRIVISTRVASLDSALVLAVGDPRGEMFKIMRTVDFDSLNHPGYQRRVLRREIGQRFERFFDGLMNHQMTVSDTLLVR
ncbi:MAG: ABC transporter permease, partial [Candidatus Krumholzibacteria bacterium]|nr:ABC transporter permease [Candidatus Krumholzibacteria bacterium]